MYVYTVVATVVQFRVLFYRYLKQISQLQLLKIVTLIKDNLNGLSLDDSLAKSKQLDSIDPNEDLNKVGCLLVKADGLVITEILIALCYSLK